jgi:hypothetical protein
MPFAQELGNFGEGCALELLRFHRHLRLENLPCDRPYLLKDGQRGRGHAVKV